MSTDLFCVFQFFPDETCECVRSYVPAEEAVEAARHYSSSVGAQIGTTRRVIITDAGDHTVFEWKYGEGVVFPPEAKGYQPKPPESASASEPCPQMMNGTGCSKPVDHKGPHEFLQDFL